MKTASNFSKVLTVVLGVLYTLVFCRDATWRVSDPVLAQLSSHPQPSATKSHTFDAASRLGSPYLRPTTTTTTTTTTITDDNPRRRLPTKPPRTQQIFGQRIGASNTVLQLDLDRQICGTTHRNALRDDARRALEVIARAAHISRPLAIDPRIEHCDHEL
jgi:hypothetical protein